MHIANIFVKCAHLSLFCPKTDKPSCCNFSSGQGANPSLSQMGSTSLSEIPVTALHAQHSLLNWDMLDSPLASLQQQPDSGAQIPQQFLKALQCCCFPLWVLSSRAGKDKTSFSEFVWIPAPVRGIMGSRDRKAGSLQVSGYSCTQGKVKGLVRWALSSSSLHGPSGMPRNLKLNSQPYFN